MKELLSADSCPKILRIAALVQRHSVNPVIKIFTAHKILRCRREESIRRREHELR